LKTYKKFPPTVNLSNKPTVLRHFRAERISPSRKTKKKQFTGKWGVFLGESELTYFTGSGSKQTAI
jgi:hypothetical protein